METIEMLISDLESELLKAKKAAFSNSDVVVNKSRMLDIVTRIRANYPVVLKEAARITADRENIIKQAETYANSIMNDAENNARRLVSESEVVKQAQQAADSLTNEANESYQRMDYDSRSHAYSLLENVEQSLSDALKIIGESKNNLFGNN